MIENEIKSIGFALDPSSNPSFLLDWEVTKKCNLDCSYRAPKAEQLEDFKDLISRHVITDVIKYE